MSEPHRPSRLSPTHAIGEPYGEPKRGDTTRAAQKDWTPLFTFGGIAVLIVLLALIEEVR